LFENLELKTEEIPLISKNLGLDAKRIKKNKLLKDINFSIFLLKEDSSTIFFDFNLLFSETVEFLRFLLGSKKNFLYCTFILRSDELCRF